LTCTSCRGFQAFRLPADVELEDGEEVDEVKQRHLIAGFLAIDSIERFLEVSEAAKVSEDVI